MRLLGIDFGTKKIGLALTDESGSMAFPYDVVPNDAVFLQNIVSLIEKETITTVVIGHSLNLDGTPNAVQTNIESFIIDLTLQTPVPIHLEPEQMTTQQAATTTGRNNKTDAAAAALILESYLAKQKHMTTSEETKLEATVAVSNEISFDQFIAIEIKLGTIQAVEIVDNADKLLKLTVDLGETSPRQIVSGIREYFEDVQVLVGMQCPFITNLAPRKIKGLVSQGMILAGEADDVFALLNPSNKLPAGTRLS
jgi:putative transcription antitermination factor YqgF